MNSTEKELDRYSENPVSGFPLTDGDLVVIAETWWDVFIDTDLFCVLTGSGLSGAEWHDMHFASDRLDRLAETLGKDEILQIRGRIEERWRQKIGEVHWNAYKTSDPIIQKAAAERSEKRARRSAESGSPLDRNSDDGGWSNAETATFHRWITTDPDIRKNWRQLVAELRRNPEAYPTNRKVREALARELREQAAKEWSRLSSGLLSDLLDIAFTRVNWTELAAALLSESERDETSKNPLLEN
jgi:hypothetical protein